MPRNIEIKAAVCDFQPLLLALHSIASGPPSHLWQEDTFFPCRDGRLKLRKFTESVGELIHYRRDNETGPKESNYVRLPIDEPDRLRDVLGSALGTTGVVRKQRTVYMVGRTRVHLDDVEHLGKYLELEVVLENTETSDQGRAEALRLMELLAIRSDQLVSCSYIDLLESTRHVG